MRLDKKKAKIGERAHSYDAVRGNRALFEEDLSDQKAAPKIPVKIFLSDDKKFFRRNKKAAGEKRGRPGNSSASSPARTIP